MKLLLITTGYLPYAFSENLCNAKLVHAFMQTGWEVDVISRTDDGVTYSAEWTEPWLSHKEHTYEVCYPKKNILKRSFEVLSSALTLKIYPITGGRWAKLALYKAMELHRSRQYDAVLTRSPNDIAHIVGYHLKHKTGIKWLANWNDPATPIWPTPYTEQLSIPRCLAYEHLVRKCLSCADINTFPSSHLMEHFQTNYPLLKNTCCKIIPHIAMPGYVGQQSHTEQHQHLHLCHAGNLSSERNPELLFRAIQELQDVGYNKIKFDIIGTTNSHIHTLIKKYNLDDVVRYIGSLSYERALHKMSEYSVLVLIEATMNKGIFFPSKLTDYVQLSKPIFAVSPAQGFAHDILTQHGCGIAVDNSNYESVKQGLFRLYQIWQEGTLDTKFSTSSIYEYISLDSVVGMYEKLLRNA